MKRIMIQFRDIPDAINRRQMTRTFTSALFENEFDEQLKEVIKRASKDGFTGKEIIKMRVVDMPLPLFV